MSKRIGADIRSLVAERAGHICEYWLVAEEDSYYRHQIIEHIISVKHGGSSEPENLALACVNCNRNKGSDVGSIVGSTSFVRFYDPRRDDWREHFQIDGVRITSLTEIGEATIRILQLNHEDRVIEREVLVRIGRYPNAAADLLITKH